MSRGLESNFSSNFYWRCYISWGYYSKISKLDDVISMWKPWTQLVNDSTKVPSLKQICLKKILVQPELAKNIDKLPKSTYLQTKMTTCRFKGRVSTIRNSCPGHYDCRKSREIYSCKNCLLASI